MVDLLLQGFSLSNSCIGQSSAFWIANITTYTPPPQLKDGPMSVQRTTWRPFKIQIPELLSQLVWGQTQEPVFI